MTGHGIALEPAALTDPGVTLTSLLRPGDSSGDLDRTGPANARGGELTDIVEFVHVSSSW
jgi:hypothetical protein